MRRARLRTFGAYAGAAVIWVFAGDARAGSDDAIASAQSDLVTVGQQVPAVQAAVDQVKSEKQTPEQRLANGELLFGMKDYTRANVVLSEIMEEYPNTPSYPDALWHAGRGVLRQP